MNIEENNPLEESNNQENPQGEPVASLSDTDESRDAGELNTSKDEYEEIPMRDYSSMNFESLIAEINHLLSNYPVNRVSKAVNSIKKEFYKKDKADQKKKKAQYIEEGGEEQGFYHRNPSKDKFQHLLSEYKKQISAFYKNQEQKQKENLAKRQALIEELKSLYREESESNSALFSTFRRIKSDWHEAGRVPANEASNIFRTYYHHLDNFYEYLKFNKELQELDYEHNLKTRYTIIERAQGLLEEENIKKSLNELQYLHKLWKEEAVPVAEEHREPTWNTFKEITQQIHNRKQEFYDLQKEKEQENQQIKEQIIGQIKEILNNIENSHSFYQKNIKKVDGLRQNFIDSGRAPKTINQDLWDEFKKLLRDFNRSKNNYYKSMKSEQNENLQKKRDLAQRAKENVDRDDWDDAVDFFKEIQREWKQIGMVPRKYSNEIWKEFNSTCNDFFDRYKNRNKKDLAELQENLSQKEEYLKNIESTSFEGLDEEQLMEKAIKINKDWASLGAVPNRDREIENKFKKTLESKIKETGSDVDMSGLNTQIKVEKIKQSGDEDQQHDTLRKIRSQMADIRTELSQLENNLSFFANAEEDNPMLKNVHRDIQTRKDKLAQLQEEYNSIKSIRFDEAEAEEELSHDENQVTDSSEE